MASTEVKLLGAEKLRKELTKLANRVGDFRPAWKVLDKYVSLIMRRQFATEGRFLGGVKWREWTPAWRKRRPRPGGNRGGILRDTARMWASFVNPNGPEAVKIEEPLQYERGSGVVYARVHQLGRGHMPKREILPESLPAVVETTILKTIFKHVDGGAS